MFSVWNTQDGIFKKDLFSIRGTGLKNIMNDMDDFTCGCDISGDLTEALKVKGVSMNRNMQCFFFIFKIREKNQRFENLDACGGLQ